jgi:AcrR family transcriptional regulator
MLRTAEKSQETRSIREHILAVAGELFYNRGIRAVGVDVIIAEAGIAKATLYRHFPGKEDIVVAYLEARKARLVDAFVDCLQHKDAAYSERILSVFDGLLKNLRAPSFRGCAFLMAVAEYGESSRVREAARSYKLFLRDKLKSLLDGEVKDSEDLAEQLLLIYEGAIATAVLRPETDPGARARRCAEMILMKE